MPTVSEFCMVSNMFTFPFYTFFPLWTAFQTTETKEMDTEILQLRDLLKRPGQCHNIIHQRYDILYTIHTYIYTYAYKSTRWHKYIKVYKYICIYVYMYIYVYLKRHIYATCRYYQRKVNHQERDTTHTLLGPGICCLG